MSLKVAYKKPSDRVENLKEMFIKNFTKRKMEPTAESKKDETIKSLRERNKDLSESLSNLSKYANQYVNGDCGNGQLERSIQEANDSLIKNSVILIDFPSYVRKKYSNRTFSAEEFISIYNQWNA